MEGPYTRLFSDRHRSTPLGRWSTFLFAAVSLTKSDHLVSFPMGMVLGVLGHHPSKFQIEKGRDGPSTTHPHFGIPIESTPRT